ncbi:MAG: hypothetical protein M3Y82_04770 [Verrucomicrobiota bacterium]|nr:hypothetical protein [Verrucomicrobiota bacterium]
MFWEYGRNNTSFIYPTIAKDRSPNVAVRDGPWKFLINADGTNAELYNLETDRNETTNVAEKNSAMAKRLEKKRWPGANLCPQTKEQKYEFPKTFLFFLQTYRSVVV